MIKTGQSYISKNRIHLLKSNDAIFSRSFTGRFPLPDELPYHFKKSCAFFSRVKLMKSGSLHVLNCGSVILMRVGLYQLHLILFLVQRHSIILSAGVRIKFVHVLNIRRGVDGRVYG